MSFAFLNNIPKQIKKDDWRVRPFAKEPETIPNLKGIYIISLKLEKFIFNQVPKLFTKADFYPIYVGEGWIRQRFREHKKRIELKDIHSKLDLWFHPLNISKEELVDVESWFIETLSPALNIRQQTYKGLSEKKYTSSGYEVFEQIKADDILKIIDKEENKRLEFKETFALNVHIYERENKKLKDIKLMEKVAITICAFLNTFGGKLIIGIKDNPRKIVGLARDLEYFFKEVDKLKGAINDLIRSTIGNENLCRIKIKEINIQNKIIILIDVTHSQHKVFFKEKIFYIRTDHGSEEVLPANVDASWKNRNDMIRNN